jgi:hypothetical protein
LEAQGGDGRVDVSVVGQARLSDRSTSRVDLDRVQAGDPPSEIDNTYLSRIRHLSLTTIDNGNFAVGVQAAKFLLERLDNLPLSRRMFLVDPELHIRRSTQAAQDRSHT